MVIEVVVTRGMRKNERASVNMLKRKPRALLHRACKSVPMPVPAWKRIAASAVKLCVSPIVRGENPGPIGDGVDTKVGYRKEYVMFERLKMK